MKRFYTVVAVLAGADGWTVALDGKPVRTPARAPLLLPTAALAAAVAAEWSAQGEVIDPRTMPLTGLSNAAIDHVAPDTASFAAGLARFAESELLCYRAEEPPALVARQAAVWDPLLDWARGRYDIGFTVATGILHRPQPAAMLARLRAAYDGLDTFRLAALDPVVTICGSAVIGLAVAERRLGPAEAWAAGQLDEIWQAEQWGEDPLAAASRIERQAALANAARMQAALAGD